MVSGLREWMHEMHDKVSGLHALLTSPFMSDEPLDHLPEEVSEALQPYVDYQAVRYADLCDNKGRFRVFSWNVFHDARPQAVRETLHDVVGSGIEIVLLQEAPRRLVKEELFHDYCKVHAPDECYTQKPVWMPRKEWDTREESLLTTGNAILGKGHLFPSTKLKHLPTPKWSVHIGNSWRVGNVISGHFLANDRLLEVATTHPYVYATTEYMKRQAAVIAGVLAGEQPSVLAGDMNTVWNAFDANLLLTAARALSLGVARLLGRNIALDDRGFYERLEQEGFTFPLQKQPPFVPKCLGAVGYRNLRCEHTEYLPVTGSDHHAVYAVFRMT